MNQPLLFDLPSPTRSVMSTRLVCPVCEQTKPDDHYDLHDEVALRHDWRKADRSRLEDPLPKSMMCHECFLDIREVFSPLAPRWDEDGVKHERPGPPNMQLIARELDHVFIS